MKNLFLVTTLLFLAVSAKSQILEPVTWSYASKRTSKTTAILYIKATIDKGWHIYSQTIPKNGPIKTSIKFIPSNNYTFSGKPIEPKPLTKFEKTFGMNVSYFENSVVFAQKVNIKTGSPTIKGSVAFMTCDETRCLPEEIVEFSIPVKNI